MEEPRARTLYNRKYDAQKGKVRLSSVEVAEHHVPILANRAEQRRGAGWNSRQFWKCLLCSEALMENDRLHGKQTVALFAGVWRTTPPRG